MHRKFGKTPSQINNKERITRKMRVHEKERKMHSHATTRGLITIQTRGKRENENETMHEEIQFNNSQKSTKMRLKIKQNSKQNSKQQPQ